MSEKTRSKTVKRQQNRRELQKQDGRKTLKAEGSLGTKNSESAERKFGDASAIRYIVRWASKG